MAESDYMKIHNEMSFYLARRYNDLNVKQFSLNEIFTVRPDYFCGQIFTQRLSKQ